MSPQRQALYLNAIPLLALAALYLLVAVWLWLQARRDGRRLRELDAAPALVFPAVGIAAAALAVLVLRDGEPLAGSAWASLAALALALVPAAAVLARRREPGSAAGGSEAEERSAAGQRHRDNLRAFADALGRTRDAHSVGRLLADRVVTMVGVEFAAVWSVEGSRAQGLVAVLGGKEQEWFREAELDLEAEPSAVATVAFAAEPLVVADAASSPLVNPRIAARVHPQSGVFLPLVAGDRVFAVLAAVTVTRSHRFSGEEVRVLQELCSEAALALERAHSSQALERALERERLVARIGHDVRSEVDLGALTTVAATEAGRALGVERASISLADREGTMTLAAEWRDPAAGELLPPPPASVATALAVREQRTVAVADAAAAAELGDPGLGSRSALADAGVVAVLATPIVAAGSVLGVFEAHRVRAHEWQPDEVDLAEAVAREVGVAAHTARLLEENERRLRHQEALLKASQVVASELEPTTVLARLVEEVARLVEADAADFYVLDQERSMLRCAAVRGLPEEVLGFEFPARQGLAGEALERGRAVLERDYRGHTEPIAHPAYAEFEHAMVAPVTWGGVARGVLGVGARRGGAQFDADDLEMLEAFGGLASLALRNAELFDERSRQARVQRGFFRIASALAEPLALDPTLDAVAHAAADALGGAYAAVLSPHGESLELVAAQALPDGVRDALARRELACEPLLVEAAHAGRILAAQAVADDDRFGAAWRSLAADAGFRSLVAVPVAADRAVSVAGDRGARSGLVLVFFTEQRRFTDDDVELAQHLAGAARGALDRASLFEQERRARALAQQLARTGSLLATELDPAAVLDEVVNQAPSLLGVDACVIRVVEDDELVVSAAVGESAEELVGARTPAGGWLSGDVAQSRAPLALADAAADARYRTADPLLERGYRGYLGVPLIGPEGTLHGVLSVYARRAGAWREEEVEALQALAGNASAALANAELYQRVALANEQSFAILANIADGIVAVNRDGHVVLWNRAAEEITGVSAADALGRTPREVLGRELAAESAQGAPGDRLVPVLRGGDEVWLSVSEAVMRDPAGAVAGRIYAFRDISADRLVEQMKSDFVSTVSEELRRPLTSIYGFAETLLRRDGLFGDEERRTFVGYIASETERLTAIVDALLNVARLETGDLKVALEPTDVGAVLAETVEEARALADGGAHRFELDLPDEPIAAEADADKLRLVLSNLLDNAVKYSPGGGVITVGLRRRGDAVEVSVADEGVGIAAGEHERIFRKFYRGDGRGGRVGGGTGLGLFIVQGLVRAMGGRIWVTSAEGEGSRFTFELALAQQPALALQE